MSMTDPVSDILLTRLCPLRNQIPSDRHPENEVVVANDGIVEIDADDSFHF